MSQLNDFITEFNLMHRSMKQKTQREDSFGSLLTYLKNRNRVIQRYYDQLNVYRELRNLIVHEDYGAEVRLTIPTQHTIDEFYNIRRKFEKPGQIGDYFEVQVTTLNMEDHLSKALDCIRTMGRSKFPVFDQRNFLGLLADKGLLYWLSHHAGNQALDMTTIQIKDIVKKHHPDDIFIYYKVKHPDTSIYEIADWFEKNQRNGRHHSVILISEREIIHQPDDILGIITVFDLPMIEEKL